MPLTLIGAGLGRTGTFSLKLALEQIVGPCYHMAEVWLHPGSTEQWIQAADGKPDWEHIFRGYLATVDYPACSFWRELAAFYPSAKVLLSVRDPDKWFESTQATIFSEHMTRMLASPPLTTFMAKTVWKEFGERIHDRQFMIAAFKRHNAQVQREIAKERLLVYEVAQGWEPLCRFLDVPVPETAFPRVNSREEMAEMVARMDPAMLGPIDPEGMKAMVEMRMRAMQGK